ncbi:hypothetical protein RI054_36g138130 [Pseudoscourfieldia marina]
MPRRSSTPKRNARNRVKGVVAAASTTHVRASVLQQTQRSERALKRELKQTQAKLQLLQQSQASQGAADGNQPQPQPQPQQQQHQQQQHQQQGAGASVPRTKSVPLETISRFPWRRAQHDNRHELYKRATDYSAAIAAGDAHVCVLDREGNVLFHGDNSHGQAPDNGLRDGPYIAVAAGNFHSMALRVDGDVVCIGKNDYGQAPGRIKGPFVSISAGFGLSAAIRADGSLVSWGNFYHQGCALPQGVGPYVTVSVGCKEVIALKSNGTVDVFQPGHGVAVKGSEDDYVAVTKFGRGGVAAIRRIDGNAEMIVGRGGCVMSHAKADMITPFFNAGPYVTLSGHMDHLIGLRADGTLCAIGINRPEGKEWHGSGNMVTHGELGKFVAACAGISYTLLLRADGSLAKWNFGYGLEEIKAAPVWIVVDES